MPLHNMSWRSTIPFPLIRNLVVKRVLFPLHFAIDSLLAVDIIDPFLLVQHEF